VLLSQVHEVGFPLDLCLADRLLLGDLCLARALLRLVLEFGGLGELLRPVGLDATPLLDLGELALLVEAEPELDRLDVLAADGDLGLALDLVALALPFGGPRSLGPPSPPRA
jgi:hypothetical protein